MAGKRLFRYSSTMNTRPRYVTVQAKGTISLPADVRRRHKLDEPGAQLEVLELEDGILLRPALPVAADQRWFWTERWQAMEREVDAQYARGEGRVHQDATSFAAHLEALDE
jgi:AbrB family looped-hinge helix DNA binding protein